MGKFGNSRENIKGPLRKILGPNSRERGPSSKPGIFGALKLGATLLGPPKKGDYSPPVKLTPGPLNFFTQLLARECCEKNFGGPPPLLKEKEKAVLLKAVLSPRERRHSIFLGWGAPPPGGGVPPQKRPRAP